MKKPLTVLRDTGCSGTVVKAQFVEKEQSIPWKGRLHDDDGQNNKKGSLGKNYG